LATDALSKFNTAGKIIAMVVTLQKVNIVIWITTKISSPVASRAGKSLGFFSIAHFILQSNMQGFSQYHTHNKEKENHLDI